MGGVVRRTFGLGALFAAIARSTWAQGIPASWTTPDDAAIRRILAQRIDTQRQGVGIVVGIVDPGGRRIVSHGVSALGDSRPLDGDTVFEIGSMTKVFTALLLAEMVSRREVALDDPVSRRLPAGVRMPQAGGRPITLADLATHTSGLPGIPTNFAPKDPLNPYADYTVEQLWSFLNGYTPSREAGARYEYSNLGFGLLGQALSHRAGQAFEPLLRSRVTAPLGLAETAVTLSPALKARMAQGHDASGQPTSNWDLPALAGAGALRSTTNDMLTFLAAVGGLRANPLEGPMLVQLAERRTAGPAMDIVLGWHVAKAGRKEIVWHNGGTGGFRSFMGLDPDRSVGVVVLTNMANEVGGDDIGFHLLTGRPLAKLGQPPSARRAITLSVEQLAGLAGRYRFAPGAELIVTQEGARLFAQLTGQPAFEIFPESLTRSFWKVVDAQATFERKPDGRATAVTLHQMGRDQRAQRADP